jgi:hypothetical protein
MALNIHRDRKQTGDGHAVGSQIDMHDQVMGPNAKDSIRSF